jgi:hypothetical protein
MAGEGEPLPPEPAWRFTVCVYVRAVFSSSELFVLLGNAVDRVRSGSARDSPSSEGLLIVFA